MLRNGPWYGLQGKTPNGYRPLSAPLNGSAVPQPTCFGGEQTTSLNVYDKIYALKKLDLVSASVWLAIGRHATPLLPRRPRCQLERTTPSG